MSLLMIKKRYQVVEGMNVMGEDGDTWTYSYYGVFDGHGGSAASEFVKDNLHRHIFAASSFPEDIDAAITQGFLHVLFLSFFHVTLFLFFIY